MKYLEFDFEVEPIQPGAEILIAELGNLGFESFVETEKGLTAYIQEEEYHKDMLKEVRILRSQEFSIRFTTKKVEQVNWNEEWEKNFHPITVRDQCVVRAPFHDPRNVKYDIIIEPKMSFGTGHHATTYMMIDFLLNEELSTKKVLDMGCGTGVLAILSEKRGAKSIDAIDIDNWCYLNTLENAERNNCTRISVFEGSAELLTGKQYDLIIANINRNILLQDMNQYVQSLTEEGTMLISGFYEEDVPILKEEYEKYNLVMDKQSKRDDWMALRLKKSAV